MATNYYNIDTGDGDELCAGLSEHEVKRVAKRHANRLGQTVYYYEAGTDDNSEPGEMVAVDPDNGDER